MSKKTLNKANLASLGADKLADLLIEVSMGSADIKRRLRLELSHNLGASELAHEVRKRLAALRKSTSYVGWRKRKALIKDLTTQRDMITDKVAPDDPTTAFDLLWQFIELAPSIYMRVDDSRGDVGDVFRTSSAALETLGPSAVLAPAVLADRVWGALQENDYGQWDHIITYLAPTLGETGLAHLKSQVEAHAGTPPPEEDNPHQAIQFLHNLRGTRSTAVGRRSRFVKSCLQEIATAMGDTAAYIAQYSPEDLTRKNVAAEVALLMLDEDRAPEALAILQGAPQDGRSFGQDAWDDAYIATLLRLDRISDAQEHRWNCFAKSLNPQHLRAYLKALPDFEDIDAEDRAKAHVAAFPDGIAALHFCLNWPDLLTASQIIEARADEIDGDRYEILTPAAETLRARYPLAAVLLWRSMINFALYDGRSSRYGHAADHLADCAALAPEITDHGPYPTHEAYVAMLMKHHERKTSFWAKVGM